MGVLTEKEKGKLLKATTTEEIIEKNMALSWDGKNLIVRFPQEIAQYLKVTKENRMEKLLKFKVKEKEGLITKTFDVINKKNGKEKKEE